jgi:hypothetical protein
MSGSRRHLWAKRGGRFGALTVSLGAHGAIFAALILAWTTPPVATDPTPITVSLIAPPPPPIPPAPPTPAKVIAPKASASRPAAPSPPAPPTPVRAIARPSRAAPTIDSLVAASAPYTGPASPGLTDAQLAGASDADTGGDGSGAGCHMAQRVQAALRRDALVRAAVVQAGAAGSRAIMVWNGDWVQNGGEDGKGLAAVREAIVWEIAFAPPACRAEHVHGLLLLSLNGASTRLAVGAGEWRWSDLLSR